MAATRNIDWEAGHGPVSGTINAAYTALAVAAVGHETGLSPTWVVGASVVGSAGSLIAGASAETPLSKGAIAARVSAWLAGGGWISYALAQDTVWTWPTVGPLLACACGFGSLMGALGRKKRRQLEREARAYEALSRVRIGREWIERFDRVCGVKGCEIKGVQDWDSDGSGYDLEVELPLGGHSWKSLARSADDLAADADLPEGCGIEVFSGVSRRRAIVKVQLKNELTTEVTIPLDASALSFNEDFDIGKLRDGGLAMINIREFSAMMVGEKRTGKTNQLLAIMTRLLRMPDLLVWVIDFNGGGVALQWLRAWDALGKPGRPPIDWVAATPEEAALMGDAAVRIAKARKVEYQDYMAEHDTDLLPLTAKVPGILIVTDEGAEVYANPAHRHVSGPMNEVLRIAGASGVNQLNCFLRATADVTGSTLIKSQSRVRIGMRMSDEQEMSYLLGWRHGLNPQDMPDRGYGALSQDEGKQASVFRGYRVLPSHIKWFVENTVCYRQNDGLDAISVRAAGEPYETRWERAEFVFNTSLAAPKVATAMSSGGGGGEVPTDGSADESWSAGMDINQAQANLRKAIEEAGGPDGEKIDAFQRLIRGSGLEDLEQLDPDNLPPEEPDAVASDPVDPDDPESDDDEANDMRDIVFGRVKAMSPEGVSVNDIKKALEAQFGADAPVRETISRWLKKDDRIERVGYGKYAIKPEEEA